MNSEIQKMSPQAQPLPEHAALLVDETLVYSRGQNPSLRHPLATSGWLLGLNGVHLGEDMRLYPGPNSIGSSARNQIVVTAPGVGRQHAVIEIISGESAILRPGSTQRDLLHNGRPCVDASPLCFGDTVQIGEQIFAFITLLPSPSEDQKNFTFMNRPRDMTSLTIGWLVELTGEREGRDFRLFAGENCIGSTPGSDIFLPDSSIKSRHAVITRHPANWTLIPHTVTDLLLVNGIPSTGIGLQNGDIIGLGKYEFLFRSIRVVFSK